MPASGTRSSIDEWVGADVAVGGWVDEAKLLRTLGAGLLDCNLGGGFEIFFITVGTAVSINRLFLQGLQDKQWMLSKSKI